MLSIIKIAIGGVEEIFPKYQEIEPMLLTQESDGTIGVGSIAFLFGDKWSKSKRRLTLQIMLMETKATACVIVTEAWTVTEDKPVDMQEYIDSLPDSLEDHPNRQEIVVINYQSHDGTCKLYHAPIYRQGDEAWLGEFEEIETNNIGGVMMNLFGRE